MSSSAQDLTVAVVPMSTLNRFAPLLAFAMVTVFAMVTLGHFHDRFWLPRDDGYYAHIAQRILGGEVLHRDVQGLHAGLVYFAHAGALALFGDELVSLRYPLAALGVVQACLLFLLSRPRGLAIAVAAGVSITALSFVQFVNPTAHWYALFLFVSVICALQWVPPGARGRLETVGFLVATLFLFRQLTGVFVAMGVVAYLISEATGDTARSKSRLAQILVAIMIAGLAGFLLRKTDGLGWLLFGVWPLVLLIRVGFAASIADRDQMWMLGRLALGAVVAMAPLTLYHAFTGSLWAWFDDAILQAFALSEFDYIGRQTYALLLLAPWQAVREPSVAAMINAVFWPVMLSLGVVLGVLVLRVFPHGTGVVRPLGPLPFVAVFYGLVPLHFQTADYLFFGIAPVVGGILWIAGDGARWRALGTASAALALSAVALHFHAAQPFSRTPIGMLSGVRVTMTEDAPIPRTGLRVEQRDVDIYRRVLDLIDAETPSDGTILAIPGNAELYFLSGRKNPLPYSFVPFGIEDDVALDKALAVLDRDPPSLVFHVPHLPYNTTETNAIMAMVRDHYEQLEPIGEFEIYRLRPRPKSD